MSLGWPPPFDPPPITASVSAIEVPTPSAAHPVTGTSSMSLMSSFAPTWKRNFTFDASSISVTGNAASGSGVGIGVDDAVGDGVGDADGAGEGEGNGDGDDDGDGNITGNGAGEPEEPHHAPPQFP